MRNFLFLLALFVPAILLAQQTGADDNLRQGFASEPVTRHFSDPPNLRSIFSKGGGMSPEALSWDAVIGKAANAPDGGTVYCFASEGDDLYLGGDFRMFDTVTAYNIVHYNRKTGRWNGLNGGPYNVVNAIAVHKGKVYVGGAFHSVYNGDVSSI